MPANAVEPPSARATWTFRILGALALVLAAWLCVYAFGRSPDQADTSPVHDLAVVEQIPAPGSHEVRQTRVGVRLLPGYDGRLTINGTDIPEDQMDGAVDTSAPNYDPRFGVRPNNRNEVFFTPGPGKVISAYRTGEVTISVDLWSIAQGERHSRRITWAIFVT